MKLINNMVKKIKWLLHYLKMYNYPVISISRRFDDKVYHLYANYEDREIALSEKKALEEQGKNRKYAIHKEQGGYRLYFQGDE